MLTTSRALSLRRRPIPHDGVAPPTSSVSRAVPVRHFTDLGYDGAVDVNCERGRDQTHIDDLIGSGVCVATVPDQE
jgi:hypothetical protein